MGINVCGAGVTKKMCKCLLLFFVIMIFGGCTQVAPWQRGYLAKSEMAFAPDPLEASLESHTYFSKEASASGAVVSGGGCGCN